MSRSNYKRLGDYIREVNVRNRDLAVTRLLGVSIQKVFMPSIANTIGTDMVTYKIVEKGQFGYGPVTSRNGDKVSIALLTEYDNAIISQAYTVFEVIDREKLLPEYLMMWFRRAEFDRYARFKSHGSAREIFDWGELCDIQLPIPAIEVQREIVSEYEALSRRIALNESLCDKLEQAASALYRKTFIDNIDPQNLPHGWRMGTIGEFCDINDSNVKKDNSKTIRYLDSSSVTENLFGDMQLLNPQFDEIPSRAQRKVKDGDIVYSTVRPNLKHYGIIRDSYCDDIVVSTAFAVIRSKNSNVFNELIYLWITDVKNTEALQSIAEMSKATYPSIIGEDILSLTVAVPLIWTDEHKEVQSTISKLYKQISQISNENKRILQLQTLLLSKLATN